MDGSFLCITLCLLLGRTVDGQWLVSHREGVIVTSSSQYNITWDDSIVDINHVVDGNANTIPGLCKCCGATKEELNPWFNVDLRKEYIIQRIHVLGRTDDYAQYLHNMEIKLGTTSLDRSVLQGVDTSDTDLRVLDYTLPSPELARFITLTLRDINTMFLICELYVYADMNMEERRAPPIPHIVCTEGTYGPECVHTCGKCQNNHPCDGVTGTCSECLTGYQYPLCQDCVDGRYGPTCIEDCGRCNNNDVCDKTNGNCHRGCSPGYQGTTCKESCSWGTYGINCANTCGRCENNAACNDVDGVCTACLIGYLSPFCKDCIGGRYGPTCDEDCGHCFNNDVCDITNGICPRGCSAGYKGKTCKEECKDGTYGLSCQYKCGNCFNNGPCNKIDGGCISCAAGYKGNTCGDECLTGTFGFNCKQRCGMCLDEDVCDIYTGDCPNGCFDEYTGIQCLQELNQDSSSSSDTRVSIPVFIGSIVVYTTIVLAWMLYRKRLNKKTPKAANNEDTSIQLPNTPSDYDTLKFDNPDGESMYTELNWRS